jgi:hypothetical protein
VASRRGREGRTDGGHDVCAVLGGGGQVAADGIPVLGGGLRAESSGELLLGPGRPDALPYDFPSYNTVYACYAAWRDEGVFAQLNYDLTRSGESVCPHRIRRREPHATTARASRMTPVDISPASWNPAGPTSSSGPDRSKAP